MTELIDERLVEEAIDAYVDWREECAGVWDADESWARATVADAAFAFSVAHPMTVGSPRVAL